VGRAGADRDTDGAAPGGCSAANSASDISETSVAAGAGGGGGALNSPPTIAHRIRPACPTADIFVPVSMARP
jgi:hypothetical protein